MNIESDSKYPSLVDFILKGFTFEQICVIYKEFYESKPHLLFKMYHDLKIEIEKYKK